MDKILETLFYSQLNQCGFQLNTKTQTIDHFYSFTLNNQIGNGFYEIIAVDNKFAIVTKNFSFHNDVNIVWPQTEYLCIETNNRNLNISWNKEYSCNFVLPAQSTITGTSITIMPKYFDMLLAEYPEIVTDELPLFLDSIRTTSRTSSIFTPTYEIIEQIKHFPSNSISSSLYYDGKIRELLALLLYKYHSQKQYIQTDITTQNCISHSDKDALSMLVLKMKDTLSAPMSIAECCKITCMGKSKLSLLFHQVYGKTVSEYYQQLRMQKAQELLIYSDLEITHISRCVGYKTHAAFSSLFKTLYGMTPSEYRMIMRHQTS